MSDITCKQALHPLSLRLDCVSADVCSKLCASLIIGVLRKDGSYRVKANSFYHQRSCLPDGGC